MKKKEIKTKMAPKAVGPYSQAVKAGNFLFLSGQIGIDPKTGKIVDGGVKKQTEQILKNISEILKKSEISEENCVKCTVYLKDMSDFSAVNQIYSQFFSRPYPARAAVEVSALPLDAMVEIDLIASIY